MLPVSFSSIVPVLALNVTGTAMTLLLTLAGAALVVFAAEYVTARFGMSPAINWWCFVSLVSIGIAYAFWHVWAQQVNFVDVTLDPTRSSFRLTLWLFLLLSVLLPLLTAKNTLLVIWYVRWMPGITLFVVRILAALVMLFGYGCLIVSLFKHLKGVNLSVF